MISIDKVLPPATAVGGVDMDLPREDCARELRVVRRITSIALTIVVVAAVFSVGAWRYATATGHDVLIERSDSMAPKLVHGDLIVTKRVKPRQVRVGDILTFADPRRNGKTLTHRAVAIGRKGDYYAFVTHGDATDVKERWTIKPDGTIGQFRAAVPKAGFLIAIISEKKNRTGLLAAAFLLVAFVVVSEIFKRGAANDERDAGAVVDTATPRAQVQLPPAIYSGFVTPGVGEKW